MAAPSIVLVLTLATVGAGGDATRIVGEVLGPDGRPRPGTEVIAAGGNWDGKAPGSIGRTTTDDSGVFVLELSDDPSTRERPTLWAFQPGSVAASRPIDRDAIEGHPVRLILGSRAGAAFVVAGPDGHPVAGAKVFPWRVAREVPDVPEALTSLSSSETNDEGKATISAFRPEELVTVRVEAAGFGIQAREFRLSDGLADVASKGITLLATGRVAGRVIAGEPQSVAGLSVLVTSSVGGRTGTNAGFAEVVTDASGRFEVSAIAAGSLTVRVRPRAGSPDLPARVIRRTLEPGRQVDLEIPLRRGVRVTGVALDDRDGRPIADVVVSVVPSAPAEPSRVRTDAEGRYEAFVPPGLVSHRVLKVPAPYLAPPSFLGPRPVEVPPAIARFELPPIALTRGGEIRGLVEDENGQPVAGARVEASWTLFDGRNRAPRSVAVTSKPDGSFVLGPVAPGTDLAVVASAGAAATEAPVSVRTDADGPVELTLVETNASAPAGRVIDVKGRPIAGASVRIWSLARSPGGSIDDARLLTFDGLDELKTDDAGRFQVLRRLRGDREYRALALARGHLPGRSRPLRPGHLDHPGFADLVLSADPERVAIEGRILDRQGRPVAGAGVWTSADGPCCRRSTTDAEGCYRLDDLPECPLCLFVEAAGFRFLGRTIDPAQGPFDITVTRLEEIPEASMTTRAVGASLKDMARDVLAPYAERVLGQGDHSTRFRTLELLARVDPKRVLALIEARGVEGVWLVDHLRHAASCGLVDSTLEERMAVVGSIQDAEWRVLGALDAESALPEAARGLRREWVDRALGDARSIREPSRRVVALARVADRLLDLGETDRATQLLAEAQPLAEALPRNASGALPRAEFAEALARVDPAKALALTEDLVDPGEFDRCRLKIARRLASRQPGRVVDVLDSLRDPRSLIGALAGLCHALAPVDPALARQLIARARTDDTCLRPYALGMMALAVSSSDKPSATAWLREAFDRLGQVAASGSPSAGIAHDPSAVAAALLPVAERIDPKLVPELFWRAVSFHANRPGADPRSDAVLALLLARYDRSVALAFFQPVADRALTSAEMDLAPLVASAAIIDPLLAVRLVEAMPEAPDLTYHHPKNQARLILAGALARGAPACWEDATARFLHLWTINAPDGD